MSIYEIFGVADAVIASLGGGALIVAAFAHYIGQIWATQMLQNERAKHAEALESIKAELDLLKQKNITRHHDKLAIYRDVVHVVCEILRELEGVALGKKEEINEETEECISNSTQRNHSRSRRVRTAHHFVSVTTMPVT